MSKIIVFKAGKHTSANGQAYEFSEADLREMASSYDTALHEAPIVLGHPKDDAPAKGWVAKVEFNEATETEPATLSVEYKQVDPEFAESVNKGAYKKRSISLYSRTSPSNPTPGKLYLKHVGYLGAMPPAVKGMPDHEFAEDGEAMVFSDWGHDTSAGLWRNLREWFIGKFGQEAADEVIPNWQVESLKEAARTPDHLPYAEATGNAVGDTPAAPAQAQEPVAAPVVDKTAEFAEKQAELDTKARELAEREAALRHAETVAFAEGLSRAGRLRPELQGRVVAVLTHLSQSDTQVEFAEGEPGKPAADLFKELLEALPPAVSFAEVSAPTTAPEPEPVASFVEASGYEADPAGLALLAKAQAHQAANPGVSILDAFKAISQTK